MGTASELRPMGLERCNAAYLDPLERRGLAWLAARLPATVTPDRLTALGFIGALVAAAAYALASRIHAMLWLASVGLVVNWFGDSLDGTLARWRGIERPRYGFFLDNTVDLIEQALLGLGLALSGYVQSPLVAAVLVTFLMVSMLSLLQAQVSRVFPIAYGGIGLTEIRCGLILWNAALFFVPPQPFAVFGVAVTYSDCLAMMWLAGNVTIFLTVMVRELRRLRIEDPPHPSPAEGPR
ncbi:MAG TPA: CDP-alcohol phosphatidyltransferase family protein [Stellaceae bacterium]|jgi:phosphatidylglycerophosphate synthase|nr:CDP-alcohol phosphatidyltransferase family protein [Stellaceae bacterium]